MSWLILQMQMTRSERHRFSSQISSDVNLGCLSWRQAQEAKGFQILTIDSTIVTYAKIADELAMFTLLGLRLGVNMRDCNESHDCQTILVICLVICTLMYNM